MIQQWRCGYLGFAVVPQFKCTSGNTHTHTWSRPLFNIIFVSNYLSKVPVRMYFPFGENLTKDTGGLSSSDEPERGGGMTYTHHLNTTLKAYLLKSSNTVQMQCPIFG